MSSVYATEPATSGPRVLFRTTKGPVEIHLWCRECPTACQFFLRLVRDGYYDQVLFHRIVAGFLIQTGSLVKKHLVAAAEQSAGRIRRLQDDGGTIVDTSLPPKYCEYLDTNRLMARRKLELHSRLRFNHRGQVAMALSAIDDDDVSLLPQFFLTLDEASELDGKHVIFGTCQGPTFFNAVRIGQCETTNGQPVDMLDAPLIESAQIVWDEADKFVFPHSGTTFAQDPLSNIVLPWRDSGKSNEATVKKKKRKGKLDVNVLSFGDELANDVSLPKPSKRSEEARSRPSNGDESTVAQEPAWSEQKESDDPVPQAVDGARKLDANVGTTNGGLSTEHHSRGPPKETSLEDSTHRMEKVAPVSVAPETKKSTRSLVETRREKYASQMGARRQNKRSRDENTMAKLLAFQGKVKLESAAGKTKTGDSSANQDSSAQVEDNSLAARMARRAQDPLSTPALNNDVPVYRGQVLENGQDVDSEWLRTEFKCRQHMDHRARAGETMLAGDGRDAERDYQVIDDAGAQHQRNKGHRHHHKSKPNDPNHLGRVPEP
jgi:peptidyl-prolyl cis-trans isomerase SDCCAG10